MSSQKTNKITELKQEQSMKEETYPWILGRSEKR